MSVGSSYYARVSVVELCRSAPDARALRLGVLEEFRRRVGFDAFVWLLTDPVTEVGAAPLADVGAAFAELPRLIELKYSTFVNRWTHLDPPVAGLQATTDGRPERSLVWQELLVRHQVRDVASMVFRDRFGCWAFLDLWRCGSSFTAAEVTVLAGHVDDVTAGLRRCVARTFDAEPGDTAPPRTGPVVLVLSSELAVRGQTPETEGFLRALVPPDGDRPPVPAGAYNVAAQLLANERGVDTHPPVARVHKWNNEWLSLRAARIGDDIAVSIEPVTSADRCDLLGRSSGLTMRETELLQRIATGGDTRSLAKQMHLSEHTVQDHLKSIFAKTGASSRRDLLVRVGCR